MSLAEPSRELDALGRNVVDSALQVHVELGPGLLESIHESCLVHELRLRGLEVERQVLQPVGYKDLVIESGLRLDLLVENQIIVEVKSVERLMPIHESQLLTYLKLARKPLGFPVNFNFPRLKEGIRRFIA